MDPDYEDRKAAARANRAFYDAFEALDLDAMTAVWLDEERIRCIHPGGEALVGPGSVLESWGRIFENTGKIRFELADLSIEIVGDLAWAACVERIHARHDDEDFTSEATATNLFVRAADGWRLLLHHASPVTRRFE